MIDKQKILEISPETLEAHGVLHHSKDGKYVCPLCGNGEGEDGTGIDFIFQDGIFKANCFRCESLNNIKILAAHYRLNYRNKKDFAAILQKAEQDFLGGNFVPSSADYKHYEAKTAPPESDLHDYSLWYSFAQKNLPNFLAKNQSVYRGISERTFRIHNVGFIPAHGQFNLPYLLFPFSKHFWQMRLAMDDSEAVKICADQATVKKIKKIFPKKEKAGNKSIMNIDRLREVEEEEIIFTAEGPFDVLSLEQVGAKCISFLGSSISREQQASLSAIEKKARIIVLGDNDEAGVKAAEKQVQILRGLGYKAIKAFLPSQIQKADGEICTIKDANDFIQVSEEGLKDYVGKILADAPEEFLKAERIDEEKKGSEGKEKKPRTTSRTIYPDCPINVVIPWGFSLGKTGLYQRFKTQDSELMTRYPVFVETIRHSATDDEKQKCKYDICWKKPTENFWRHIYDIPAHQIADSRALQKVFAENQILVDSKTASRLSTYFARMLEDPDNAGRIPEKIIYTETGWTDNNFTNFVYPTDKKGDSYIENSFNFEKIFTSKGNKQKSLDLLKETIFTTPEARLAFGCVVSAPIIKPLHLRNVILHMWGTSEIGKTSFLKAPLSIFGNPELLQGNWSDTPNYILQRANKFQDLPVFIDDTQKMHQKTRNNIDTIIYKLDEGSTKGRLTEKATAMDVTYAKYSVVSTGEQPISTFTTQQGVLTRTIQIKCDGFIPSSLAKKCRDITANNYGHFGRDFVAWLAKDGNIQNLKKYRDRLYDIIRYRAAKANGWKGSPANVKDLTKKDVSLIDTHVQNLATCLTALHAFGTFAFDNETAKIIEQYINFDIDDFIKNQTLQKLSSNAERLLPAIKEATDTQSKRFLKENRTGTKVYPTESNLPTLGIKLADGRTAFFITEFKKFVRELGAQSAEEIISGLHDLGALDEDHCKTTQEAFKHCKSVSWIDGTTSERIKRWMLVLKNEE